MSSIVEEPRNFLVDKEVPTLKNKAPAAAPALSLIEVTMAAKEKGEKNNSIPAPKTPGDMTLI